MAPLRFIRAALGRVAGPGALAPLLEVPSFAAAYDHWSSTAPTATLAVCATPRNGSTLLCHGLWTSELGGKPAEYFHYRRYPELLVRWRCLSARTRLQLMVRNRSLLGHCEATLKRYCGELIRWRTGPNAVFGIKIHGWQWLRELAPRRLDELFPGIRCVLLAREDRLGQAISLVRARQTNQYRGSQPTARQPEYRAEAIRAALDELAAEEATWTRYFGSEGSHVLSVSYEQLVADYRGTVAAVLQFIGASPNADFSLPSPALRRQADHLSEEWRQRFQEGAA